MRGFAQILARLDERKVLFRSATEPFDTSCSAGRMMVQILGVFAEFERASIVERMIAGMERKAARGEWTGGSVPFGYRLDPERRYLAPSPPRRRWCRSSPATPNAWRAPRRSRPG